MITHLVAHRRVAALGLGLGLALAACSTSTTAPDDDALTAFAKSAGGLAWPVYTFAYDPTRAQSFDLGLGSRLDIPAGALCDPKKSSYGPTEWNKSCPAAKSPLTITVQAWTDDKGNVRVEFAPAIRFSPSQQVMLSLNHPTAALNPSSAILYCSSRDSCIDEGLTDPDLRTQHDPITGYVRRRIKHFSGYNVAAREEEGS